MKDKILACALVAGLFATATAEQSLSPAPRFKGLGRHHHRVTTKWELAQRYFDQGLTLCYNFNHAEAVRSFQGAATVDPDCAMAYWGIAFAYGPNINAPMDDAAVPKAWQALQKALALRHKASEPERAYIDALAKRYGPEAVKDRSVLDQSFADAMREVAKKYPNDLDAQTLYAESLMDTAPWNYWQEDMTPKPAAKEALRVIESILARSRSHMGADHLYIHLVEAGPNPEKGVPSAERIGRLAPRAGHLVHMASHIYVRVGRYHEASEVNERASAVDESYLKVSNLPGTYPGGYYPHNLHFLWYATDLEGRSKDSIAAAKKTSQYTLELRCGAIEGPRQRYLPLLAFARFGKWDEILKEQLPGTEYPFDRTMTRYARALAYASKGQASQAQQEFEEFKKLKATEEVKKLDNPYFPGTQILTVAEHILAGKLASNDEARLQALREAVKAEDTIPYMEPPYWYYSAKLSLGAGLLKAGKAAEAEKVFREDLKDFPGNGWPLYGLEKSLRAQSKTAEASDVARQFKKAWRYADTDLNLSWF